MLERIDITVGRADLARAAREGSERVLRRVLLGQDLARPDAAADARVADGDVAGEPAPRRRRRVGESERGTETLAELLELHAAIRLRRPLRRRERKASVRGSCPVAAAVRASATRGWRRRRVAGAAMTDEANPNAALASAPADRVKRWSRRARPTSSATPIASTF